MHEKEDYTINRLAEFSDKEVEGKYFQQDIFSTIPFLRKIILVCGLMFFVVSVYDVFYYAFDASKYLHSIVSRGIGLIVAIAFFILAPKMKNARWVARFITLFELTIVLGYIYILYSRDAQGYVEQAMTIMLMIFCIYMLPNRWTRLLFTSVLIVAVFMLLTPLYIDELEIFLQIEIAIVLSASVVLASAFFYRDNYSKRRRYAESSMRAYMSYIDKLTGIYNRSKFDEELEKWCGKDRRNGQQFSVLLFDVDNFKLVNDEYGHLVGDDTLKGITRVIAENIRGEDIFARWGGEEFVVLLPDAETETATEMAERLREKVASTLFETVGQVTISFGVVIYQNDDTPVTIMQRVDKAVYKSKAEGRNAVTHMS